MKKMLTGMGKTKIVLIVGGVIVVIGFVYLAFHKNSGQYQFVSVTQGTITEVVSVTGNTTPVQSLDLAFQNGGTISAVNKNIGDHVNQGDLIAQLDTSGLQAQLAQAQASVDAAKANLASLEAGAQPADIQQSQAALAGGQQTLINTYGNVANTLADGYAKANDAVRNQLSAFFLTPEGNNPQLSFNISNSQVLNDVDSERLQASTELNAWQIELGKLNGLSPSSTLDVALQNAVSHLNVIKSFLISTSQALLSQPNLPTPTVNAYNSDVTNALDEVNTASNNVNTVIQNIASEKISIQQLQAALDLKLAGSTQDAIQAQEAAVEQAEANEQSVQVSINDASMVSPINGVVTVQNAKVGEIASPGVVLASIISDNNLEVDADVPETDIGKVNVGDVVNMTFDAFPGETFTGKLFYIDPAQTIISGVVDYLVKVSFDKVDPRMKSGLTANLDINTQTDQNALILPQFAIIQNTSGTFVDILKNGVETQIPVTLGISDQNGNVEVASGVTQGEQVLNIGLKP